MQIELNGAQHDVAENCVLSVLLETLDLHEKRLAVEVNQDIVPRSQFQSFVLSTGDKVEIVKAVGGG